MAPTLATSKPVSPVVYDPAGNSTATNKATAQEQAAINGVYKEPFNWYWVKITGIMVITVVLIWLIWKWFIRK